MYTYAVVISLAIFTACLYLLTHSGKFTSDKRQDAPILSSANMLGESGLHNLHKGKMAGFDYSLLTNSSGRVMTFVNLGHNTQFHLVAIGDKSGLDPIIAEMVSDKLLEPVSLEGDFPSYFHLYVSPEKQIELRQVMEPSNMADLVDFCRSYTLEIFHDTLYASQKAGATDDQDETTLTADVQKFLEQNSRMLSRL